MQGGDRSGKENIDTDDMVIPRLALTQGVSNEVQEGLVSQGHFWHTILEEDWGKEIDDLVIVHHSKRYVLWEPRHMSGGILARASDGKNWDPQFAGMSWEIQPYKDQPRHKVKWSIPEGDLSVGRDIGLGAWGSTDPDNPDSPPAATLTHVLVCVRLSRPDDGPFTILLQRASEKIGKGLLTKINLDKAPIYGMVFKLSCQTEDGPTGDDFNNYKFVKNGYVADRDVYEQLRELNERLTAEGVKVDDSTADGSANSGDAEGDDGGDDY